MTFLFTVASSAHTLWCSHQIKYRRSLEICVHLHIPVWKNIFFILRNACIDFFLLLLSGDFFFYNDLTTFNTGQLILHTRLDAHKVLHSFWWHTISVKRLLLFTNEKYIYFLLLLLLLKFMTDIPNLICTHQRTESRYTLSFTMSFISQACW